ncbi:MAG: MmcQ/YjbR family DNA-binding protein [Alphaproteobacteria bacterium]
MLKEILQNKKAIPDRLIKFGFKQTAEKYVYSVPVMDKQFRYDIVIDKKGTVEANLFDTETNDKYILHLMEGSNGAFIGQIRNELTAIWEKIIPECFETEVFKSTQAKKIIQYILGKYGDKLEFLWQKFPNNAIWRRKDNNKWYGALLTVSKRKLGFDSNEIIEIIDLRIDPNELEKTINNKKYFAGYHMNKKNWITICLDGSVDFKEITRRIDDSYILTNKK